MTLGRMYRFVLLVAAGGMVFQTTSCTSEVLNALATSLSDTLSSTLNTQVTTYINQLLGLSA
jgi:hypothetical protein